MRSGPLARSQASPSARNDENPAWDIDRLTSYCLRVGLRSHRHAADADAFVRDASSGYQRQNACGKARKRKGAYRSRRQGKDSEQLTYGLSC